MRLTRNGMYVMTAIAAALYTALLMIFSNPWYTQFTLNSHFWSEFDAREKAKIWANGTIWTYVALAIIIAIGIYQAQRIPAEGIDLSVTKDSTVSGQVDDPKGWKLLMGNTWFAILWLPLRFYIGLAFLSAGEGKFRSAWSTGAGLKGYWTGAVANSGKSGGPFYSWYTDFLQFMLNHHWYTWFATLIQWGELLVGIGLIVGALVGIAAFFGTFLNMNFLMAGTISTNPVLFGLGVFLVLGWKVAGYLGVDRYLLPALGAPWAPGRLIRGERPTTGRPTPTPQGGRAD